MSEDQDEPTTRLLAISGMHSTIDSLAAQFRRHDLLYIDGISITPTSFLASTWQLVFSQDRHKAYVYSWEFCISFKPPVSYLR
jgi:hypothetical protein